MMLLDLSSKARVYLEEQKKRGRKTDKNTLGRMVKAFKPYKIQIMFILGTILCITILELINPFMIARIFDDAFPRQDVSRLFIYVFIMSLTPITISFVGMFQSHINNIIGQNVMRDIRNNLYRHMQRMSLSFFTSTKIGEIQSRLSTDVNGIQSVVTGTMTNIISNISTLVSTVIAMLIISPTLTIISLSLLPLFLWITYKVGTVRRNISKESQKSMAKLSSIIQETLSISGILLIKIFGREKYAVKQFEEESQHLTDLQVQMQVVVRWLNMFVSIFFSIAPALVYLLAGYQIINHTSLLGQTLTMGAIITFTTLQSRIFYPLGQLLHIQVELQGALALFDRIFEYLDIPISIRDKPNALSLQSEKIRGEISFCDVSFSYKKGEFRDIDIFEAKDEKKGILTQSPISSLISGQMSAPLTEKGNRSTLRRISFTIKPGQLAALVGPSGAGKTTITYMVSRLYEADSGAVTIDNYDVKDVTTESLCSLVGMVTQETYLFHSSIRENLLYARADASEEEMVTAAKAAAIHERIMELEEGYDTIVGERGYKLSGGEKQRIAIARVILKNPRILILDEATSSLDTYSERLIQAALEPLIAGRTTLAIAHRLSTIQTADIILVVDKGEIVEQGTHHELLAQRGLYAKLYKEQFM
jgi:ATP-binding cassette subfamily B protein